MSLTSRKIIVLQVFVFEKVTELMMDFVKNT